MRLSTIPSTRKCAGNVGPGPPRPPRAGPAATVSALVISMVQPGIWNFVKSAHLLADWAYAPVAARDAAKAKASHFIDSSLLFPEQHRNTLVQIVAPHTEDVTSREVGPVRVNAF